MIDGLRERNRVLEERIVEIQTELTQKLKHVAKFDEVKKERNSLASKLSRLQVSTENLKNRRDAVIEQLKKQISLAKQEQKSMI